MASKSILEEIELKYDVGAIKLNNGTPIWPLIRQTIYFKSLEKQVQYSNKLRTRNKLSLVKNFFYGLPKFFSLKNYDYFYFNNTDKRELYNGQYFDIYYDAWADILGQDKSLFIEWAIDEHLPKSKVHSKHIISDLPFKVIEKIISFFVSVRLDGRDTLNAILKEYSITVDIDKVIKEKWAIYLLHRYLFKKYKPKKIFVLSSFTKMSIVFAAKQLNIPVIEPQHGFIGKSHPFYNAIKRFPKFYPDTLISFGSFEKEAAIPEFIFDTNQIVPVGSFQLDLVKKREIPSVLKNLQKNYERLFCVTLQAIQDKQILDWVVEQAKQNPSWLFIIRPKQPNYNLESYTLVESIITLPEISTYDVLKACHYNITIFSTTVIEGIYLGAKPILYNIDDLPKKYFDLKTAKIALVENGEPLEQKHLEKAGTFPIPYFVDNYFDNVAKAAQCI